MNSNFPVWWHLYPVAGPTLLGLLNICLSKACLGPILQDQIASGENTLSKKMMRERVSCCRQGGSQQEGTLLNGCLSPKEGSWTLPVVK